MTPEEFKAGECLGKFDLYVFFVDQFINLNMQDGVMAFIK